jgi:hypothetical protein
MTLQLFATEFTNIISQIPGQGNEELLLNIQEAEKILTEALKTTTVALNVFMIINQIFADQTASPHQELYDRIRHLCALYQKKIEEHPSTAPQNEISQKSSSSKEAKILPLITDGYLFAEWEKASNSIINAPHAGIKIHDSSETLEEYIRCTIAEKAFFVQTKALLDFLYRNDLTPFSLPKPELVSTIIENIAEAAVTQNISKNFLKEIVRRTLLEVRLFKIPTIKLSSEELPSVKKLVTDYLTRGLLEDIFLQTPDGSQFSSRGLAPKGKTDEERQISHEEDKQLLLTVTKAHNAQFRPYQSLKKSDDEGVLQKLDLPSGNLICCRGDLHSDLPMAIEWLLLLQNEGHLDSDFHPKPGFHFFFEGDLMHRGINDVEIFTLLLILRMENPTSVHITRGNHETIPMQVRYSHEMSFFTNTDNIDLFATCYETFPLAIYVSGIDLSSSVQSPPEFVHFSHALLNPNIDLAPMLESKKDLMPIPKTTALQERVYYDCTPNHEKKMKEAFAKLQKIDLLVMKSLGYYWYDVQEFTGISKERGTYGMCIEDIHAYMIYAANNARVRACIRAHQHIYREYGINKSPSLTGAKVILTTLPVATMGGSYGELLGVQKNQGFILEVAPHVRDWKKRPIVLDSSGTYLSLYLSKRIYSMYQPIEE